QRQINIDKARSYERVASQVAKGGLGCRIGEDAGVITGAARGNPLSQGIVRNRERSHDNRSYRVARAGDGGGGDHYVKGIAALRAENRGDLPSTYEPVALEGQVVNGVDDEPLPRVEVRTALAAGYIGAVRDHNAIVVARRIINGVRPGVRRVELQAMRE